MSRTDEGLLRTERYYSRAKGVAEFTKGSSLVANILEENFKGTRTTDTETEDLKKKLDEKEAALNELHAQDIGNNRTTKRT
jgi:hypothetical protein